MPSTQFVFAFVLAWVAAAAVSDLLRYWRTPNFMAALDAAYCLQTRHNSSRFLDAK